MFREIKTSTGLIIIFGLAVILFGGVYTYFNVFLPDISSLSSANYIIVPATKTETSTAAVSAEPASTQSVTPSRSVTPAEDQLIYSNSAYGFSLTMTSSWKDYKVKEANVEGSLKSFYFELPTTDPLYQAASSTSDAGYVSRFAIGVMAKADWTGAEEQMRDFGSKIGEKGNYVFTLSHGQATSTDFSAVAEQDIKTITDSFKVN